MKSVLSELSSPSYFPKEALALEGTIETKLKYAEKERGRGEKGLRRKKI